MHGQNSDQTDDGGVKMVLDSITVTTQVSVPPLTGLDHKTTITIRARVQAVVTDPSVMIDPEIHVTDFTLSNGYKPVAAYPNRYNRAARGVWLTNAPNILKIVYGGLSGLRDVYVDMLRGYIFVIEAVQTQSLSLALVEGATASTEDGWVATLSTFEPTARRMTVVVTKPGHGKEAIAFGGAPLVLRATFQPSAENDAQSRVSFSGTVINDGISFSAGFYFRPDQPEPTELQIELVTETKSHKLEFDIGGIPLGG